MRYGLQAGFGVLAVASLALAGCGSGTGSPDAADKAPAVSAPADAPAPAVAAAPSLASAPAAFGQCAACHSLQPGKHGIGPSLFGIYGTKAGAVPGYAFSEPLKASGLTWDDATLDAWLAAPMTMVPGTRMTYTGMPDAAKRKALIAFLKTLK